jgi:hypothetical protein
METTWRLGKRSIGDWQRMTDYARRISPRGWMLYAKRSNTPHLFKDWLTVCVASGRDPFNKRRKLVIDISSELAKQFDEVFLLPNC